MLVDLLLRFGAWWSRRWAVRQCVRWAVLEARVHGVQAKGVGHRGCDVGCAGACAPRAVPRRVGRVAAQGGRGPQQRQQPPLAGAAHRQTGGACASIHKLTIFNGGLVCLSLVVGTRYDSWKYSVKDDDFHLVLFCVYVLVGRNFPGFF